MTNKTELFDKKIVAYLQFLKKWNATHNLTAIDDIETMQIRHVQDSLSIVPYVTGNRIVDVGSGAGFPGVPLALVYPEKQFVLLDSKAKKTAFLRQAVVHIGLSNVRVVKRRAETTALPCFDHVVTRAVGSLSDMIKTTQHLLCAKGTWLAMKGAYPEAELHAITLPFTVHRLIVPGLCAKRHVVVIEKGG